MIEYIFLVIFFILSIIEIFGEFKDNNKIIYALKPLLMPMLIFFYIFGVIEATGAIFNINWLIIVALLGGMLGDIFLMLKNEEKWFLFGMIAFLINQIFYIIAFFLSTDYAAFNPWVLFLLGPTFLILVFAVPRFLNKSGDMKMPVLVYMAAILLMHIAALIRLSTIQNLASILIFIGSISFIFSDSGIAVNKWAGEFTNARLIIMTTYLMAQFYITLGVLLIAIV